MGFNKIVGHDKIIDHLKNAISQRKLSHGYIFQGQGGIGKFTLALEFIKAINCREKVEDSCDKCPSCVKINNHNYPDLFIIEADGKSVKNKQIEDFQREILLRPYEGEYKAFIIRDADLITERAQNRILKVLEEPPQYGLIIFISENPKALLPTIKSRCQIIKFNNLSKEIIENYLVENYEISREEAKVLSSFSGGSLGKAVKLLESKDFKDRRNKIIDIIDIVIKGDPIKLIDSVSFFEENQENIEEILDFIIIWFRDILLLKELGEEYVYNGDKI